MLLPLAQYPADPGFESFYEYPGMFARMFFQHADITWGIFWALAGFGLVISAFRWLRQNA